MLQKANRVLFGAVLGLFGALCVFNSNASAQTYVFGRADFAVGTSPSSVAVGDFNGDGKLDLAVANSGNTYGNTISVLLGKPNGTFGPKVDWPVGSFPFSLTVGDFNRDGNLDLAVANVYDRTVSILLGNGDGTFQPRVDYATGGSWVVIADDFNGDGKLDLAVTNGTFSSFGNTVSILLGNGDGTFQAHADYATGNGAYWVAAADLNGDGKTDIVVTNHDSNTISILLGNGDGTFQAHVDYATGNGPFSVAVADFNGDNNVDLVVANGSSNTLSVLLGKGDGTFQAHVDYATGNGPFSVTVGDFNGDNKVDLAAANYNPGGVGNTVSVLLGNGDGTFQDHRDYATGLAPAWVTVSDINGDGKLDLAVANSGSDSVSILIGRGNGTFGQKEDYATGAGASVTTADFNGDGKPDLAVANGFLTTSPNTVSVLLGNGDGTFRTATDFATGGSPYSLVQLCNKYANVL